MPTAALGPLPTAPLGPLPTVVAALSTGRAPTQLHLQPAVYISCPNQLTWVWRAVLESKKDTWKPLPMRSAGPDDCLPGQHCCTY